MLRETTVGIPPLESLWVRSGVLPLRERGLHKAARQCKAFLASITQGDKVNPVERFNDATNRRDINDLRAALHPDFEMIVPQKPRRGFKGVEQEIKNMEYMFETHPDLQIEVLRMAENGDEIWTENHLTADGIEMAAVVIFGIDRETDTIRWGRYFSDAVTYEGPGADEWLEALHEEP